MVEGARWRCRGPRSPDQDRFFVPPYVGQKGWIGVYLDGSDVDWDELGDLIADSYRLIAPKRLITELDDRRRPGACRTRGSMSP
ncbi:MAG: hypothetical protein ACRDTD_01165 [Pseudonocardiaceae bacterium]